MATVTISIPDSMKLYVEDQVKANGFGNVSEYFRSLVRDAQQKERDRRLEDLLLQGLESEAIPVTDEFWKDLRAEAADRLAQQNAVLRELRLEEEADTSAGQARYLFAIEMTHR